MASKILIAGGSGLIGSRLTEYLPQETEIHILSRSKKTDQGRSKYFQWDTDAGTMDLAALEGVSVVINLAGAGVADKRWTAARKHVLLESRTKSIETLAAGIGQSRARPELYVGASAIGYYGHTADKIKVETDGSGTGFLAELTQKWEAKQELIYPLVERNVLLRIGIVLSKRGGALKEMLRPAALGVYGYFGNGEAYYSWVHIDDICKMIVASMLDDNYDGIYNATAPEPLTIKELIKSVKQAKGGLGLVMPVPSLALKLGLGEMSSILTDSMRVLPKRLLDEGFTFDYREPVQAIKDILERKV